MRLHQLNHQVVSCQVVWGKPMTCRKSRKFCSIWHIFHTDYRCNKLSKWAIQVLPNGLVNDLAVLNCCRIHDWRSEQQTDVLNFNCFGFKCIVPPRQKCQPWDNEDAMIIIPIIHTSADIFPHLSQCRGLLSTPSHTLSPPTRAAGWQRTLQPTNGRLTCHKNTFTE